jgi:hypothetical protein
MSGSGTTGEACLANERYAILCDISEEYTRIAEERLGVARIDIDQSILSLVISQEHRIPQAAVSFPQTYPRLPARRLHGCRDQLNLEMR